MGNISSTIQLLLQLTMFKGTA